MSPAEERAWHESWALCETAASDALASIADMVGVDPVEHAAVLCAVRELVRECGRLARRVKALEARETEAIKVLGGRQV